MNLLLISSFVSCQLVAIYSAESCSLEENYAYYGNAIETDGYIWSDTIKTPQQCQQKCSETSGCKFFSWTHLPWRGAKPYLCALKHSNNGRKFRQGYISGPACKGAPTSSDCKCGLAKRATRIVGGVQAGINEYPWQIGIVSKGGSSVWCGGSLVSNRWVLTAAHCTRGESASSLQVLVGEHDYDDPSETNTIRLDVVEIKDHPSYDHPTTDYDFSLLKLASDIDFEANSHIRPVCLPTDSTNTYAGQKATVTGWGTTSSGGSTSNVLLEVDVNVLSNEECKNNYNYPPARITGQMMCANVNGGGEDACQGDSGGPLVSASSGDGVTPGQNYDLIGVVSWGWGCADANYPGVYARVTEQLSWINNNAINGYTTCPRE